MKHPFLFPIRPFLSIISALFIVSAIPGCNKRDIHDARKIDVSEILNADTGLVDKESVTGHVLIFVKWTDFNCGTCFDSFHEVVTAISDLYEHRRLSMDVFMIASLQENEETTRRIVEGTVRSRGWKIPRFFVEQGYFVKNNLHKSSIAIVTTQNEVKMIHEFPLKPDEARKFFGELIKVGYK